MFHHKRTKDGRVLAGSKKNHDGVVSFGFFFPTNFLTRTHAKDAGGRPLLLLIFSFKSPVVTAASSGAVPFPDFSLLCNRYEPQDVGTYSQPVTKQQGEAPHRLPCDLKLLQLLLSSRPPRLLMLSAPPLPNLPLAHHPGLRVILNDVL
jgi:hypothetical protein